MNIYRVLSKYAGLTLVELVVSLAMLVLIMATAVPVWQLGLRIWQRESAVLAVQQEERIVMEVMAREIRRARKASVKIAVDDSSGQPALQFEVDEGVNIQSKIKFLQDGSTSRLIRRKDKGDGEGTNVYLTNLNLQNGFSFAFVEPHSGNSHSGVGEHLADYEVVELVLRCRRDNRDFVTQTQVAPRN